jgi:hypothetical protein
MICAWCYGDIAATDHAITNRHDERVHIECAITEVGLGVPRTDEERMRYLGMTDAEIAAERR